MSLNINILAQTDTIQLPPIEVMAANIFVLIIAALSLTLLLNWLGRTRIGSTSLLDARPRRNSMAFYTPIIPFMLWMLMGVIFASIIQGMQKHCSAYAITIFELIATLIIYAVILTISVFIIKMTFVRGFKGIGLGLGTFFKDFSMAFVRLFTVIPAVTIMMLITLGIGKLLVGPDWSITPHESLKLLEEYPELASRILLIFVAVIMAPIVEEILFRGLFQTMFRNFMPGPWGAIFATSAIFALAHPDPVHIPILFTLAAGLGYAYEKSGSLLQCMFMHAMFNATSVIGTLVMAPQA